MSDEKQYKTEFSFSFGSLGKSVSSLLESMGVGADAEIKEGFFSEAIDGAESAEVVLDLTVGHVTVRTLADSDNLIEAQVTYIGEIEFASRHDGLRKQVRLGQRQGSEALKPIRDALGAFAKQDDLRWDIALSPNIPLDLVINSGVTANGLDLSGLQIASLKFNGGTGNTQIMLPTMGAQYPVSINSGTGEVKLDIAPGALVNLRLNNGTGATQIVVGNGAFIDAHITGGIGATSLELPAGVPARIKASSGLGKVSLPDHYVRTGGEDFIATSGTWETADYAEADQRIQIRFEGGLGGFIITERK